MPARRVYEQDPEKYKRQRREYYAANREREIARELNRKRAQKLAILRRKAA